MMQTTIQNTLVDLEHQIYAKQWKTSTEKLEKCAHCGYTGKFFVSESIIFAHVEACAKCGILRLKGEYRINKILHNE